MEYNIITERESKNTFGLFYKGPLSGEYKSENYSSYMTVYMFTTSVNSLK